MNRDPSFGFRVLNLGMQVSGLGGRVSGFGFDFVGGFHVGFGVYSARRGGQDRRGGAVSGGVVSVQKLSIH